MELTRRGFLKLSGAGIGTAALVSMGFNISAYAAGMELRTSTATETTTVCPYCSVGCSAIVSVIDGKPVAIEGLPDSPVNRGSLCSKGQAILQVSTSDRRLNKVRVREPNSEEWKEISWEKALDEIAELIKETRDANFKIKDDKGITVNRCDAIANLGGAALDNEELHMITKFARALGLVYIEHQARI